MQPHPYFKLLLHTTGELERELGERIVAREEMHLWPLSSVESLTTSSGKRFVYKVQHEPTVEPEFYARASTPLLPPCKVLQRDAQQAALLMPFLQAPTLHARNLDAAGLLERGREVLRQIAGIEGDLPLYKDLGTLEAWRAFSARTLDMLSALVRSGVFVLVGQADLDFLGQWVNSPQVLAQVDQTSQLIHGDLTTEHVFVLDDGYRVIDWQRPYRGPGEIDLVTFLESEKIPAQDFLAPAVFGLRWFLFLDWAVEAKTNLLPDIPIFDHWARNGIDHILSAAA